ncbi:hypothetical protein A2U01_0000713 [Trifolium medium]|uniref:Uncharacterized protein n=1 Tax=Trifolium medium TaxID=97028 RepID=A0A392LYB2_9FABA|nr:hypothetical protein [Trifolium medium]
MEPIPISRKPNNCVRPDRGQICVIPIIGSNKRFRVLVTKNDVELLNWILMDIKKAAHYPLPCGYAVSSSSSSSKNKNKTLPHTIHLCGVDEYAIIYQIDKEKGVPSFVRKALHSYSFFPTTFERFDYQTFDPIQFGRKVFLRDYIPNPDASIDNIFSTELNLPLAVPTTYFNWEMDPGNYSDQQIIYGAMISYGAMKMHQKLFAWPQPPPMRLQILLKGLGDGIRTTCVGEDRVEFGVPVPVAIEVQNRRTTHNGGWCKMCKR